MQTVRIAVGYGDNIEHHEVSEAAWDLFLSAAEIGIEGAADGASDAHVEDAGDLIGTLREQIGFPGSPNHPTYETSFDEETAAVRDSMLAGDCGEGPC